MSFCRKDVNNPNEGITGEEISKTVITPDTDKNGFKIPFKDLVALTAVFNEKNKYDGRNIERLVLLDYNNPENYRVVNDTNFIQVVRPKFSPDKSKILFGDETLVIMDAGPPLFIYNLVDSSIYNFGRPRLEPLTGIETVWNLDNSSFYYSNLPAWGFAYIYFYQLSPPSQYLVLVPERSAFVKAMINPNTLLILKELTFLEDEKPEFYLLNLLDNSLGKIDNPYLTYTVNGRMRAASHFDWNSESELLVYSENGKISVTNLDGSYYRNYTQGNRDYYPVWGPEGKTVLFQRGSELRGRIMVLNVETGEVREFVIPETIDNAIALRFPDY